MGEVIFVDFGKSDEDLYYESSESFLKELFEFLEEEDKDIIQDYINSPSIEAYMDMDLDIRAFVDEYYFLLWCEREK